MSSAPRRGDRGRGGFRGRGAPHGGGGDARGGGRGGGGPRGGFYRGRGDFDRGARPRGRGGFSSGPVVFPADGVIHPTSVAVTNLENALQTSKNDPLQLQQLILGQGLPGRPGYGTKGAPVTLWANYVEFTPASDLTLHRYAISVSPAVTGKKLTHIVRLLLQTPELASYQGNIVTDFKSTLLSRVKLPGNSTVLKITYRENNEDEPLDNAREYDIRLQFTGTLSVQQLVDYLKSADWSAHHDNKMPMIQALGILLSHYAKSAGNLVAVGSSKTFSIGQDSPSFDLGAGLTAIRGFFASVRAATSRILVNVNVSHGAFYNEGPLDRLVLQYDPQLRSKSRLNSFLKRLRIRTTHLPVRKNKRGETILRIKTILGVATPNDGQNPNPPRVKAFGAGPNDVEFWVDHKSQSSGGGGKKGKKKDTGETAAKGPSGGKYISVAKFFSNTYDIQLRPDLPVVNVGNREKPTYLPLEVCHVLPGQTARSKLNPGQTQRMIQFAVRKPWANAHSVVSEGIKTAGLSPQTNALLGQFGITTGQSLITVPGRVLVEPKVLYRNMPARVAFGSWNLANVKFMATRNMRSWSYLWLSLPDVRDPFDQAGLVQILQKFTGTLADRGIAGASAPVGAKRLQLQSENDPRLDADIATIAGAGVDVLLVILPCVSTSLYDRIKLAGDRRSGVHTVCVVGSKLAQERGQDQYFSNVALKFNLKMGGNNQSVDNSRLGLITEDKTMIVGIDVTHPSPGSTQNAPSVAAMVASVDKYLGQWPGVLRIQSVARQEMVSDLKDMLKSRLHLWKDKGKHKALPENILIYRDGVSEGQYQKVIDEELPSIRKACKEMYPAPDQAKDLPRITIVIVSKRHHTRFYTTKESDQDRSTNSKPGTVVDRGVTEARNWDFYLQSHAAIQGTARPAHYFVVLDEIFSSRHRKTLPPQFKNVADVLEDLTQSLCYTFGRATKAVSLCTPAYYADILCERARRYLSGVFDSPDASVAASTVGTGPGQMIGSDDVQIHPRLKDSMFYI